MPGDRLSPLQWKVLQSLTGLEPPFTVTGEEHLLDSNMGRRGQAIYDREIRDKVEGMGVQSPREVALDGWRAIPGNSIPGNSGVFDDLARHDGLSVFISYAHEDERLRQALETHLALLKRQGLVRTWHDRRILPGQKWAGEIDGHLEAADLVLLLVSADFIASDYCWEVETKRAMGRHEAGQARVVPVILRPCEWRHAPFGELQALPKHGKPVVKWKPRDEAWLDVARGIREVLGELGAGERPGDTPRPRYANKAVERLSRRLEELFESREHRVTAGEETQALDAEILDVRRMLRKGPQLKAGEFLADGRYKLLEALGKGGFATVWKSYDRRLRKLVAIKVLHGQHSEDRSRRERFFRGARKMAELQHQHIVRVFESEMEEDDWHFFTMEYVAGGDFQRAVLAGRLSLDQKLDVILQVGEALEFAHQQGQVHRDVKPSNILLGAGLRAKLTDFDLVRADDTTGLTATRAMMGTLYYAAPETLVAAADVEAAADVYSLGSTAVFAVLGQALPRDYYRDPRRTVGGLATSEGLRRVLDCATALEVEKRYRSMEELCEALAEARRRDSNQDPSPLPRRTREPRGRSRGKVEERPPWATDAGRDDYGPWASFEVRGVAQKLRWIPPGHFHMGSPESEAGRDDDEGPRHSVTLSEGFWLADTPCTQALWEAVTGRNPGRFRSPRRPVEQVSWNDCQEFLSRLNELAPGLEARLPTEAQWEYACRAGTQTATWIGDLKILGERNAPILDEIAWYGGNSGVEFDLKEGVDSSGWPEKQYDHRWAGTHYVALKRPNPWGLYDMLGNVWEWCADWSGDYSDSKVVDPIGPDMGAYRVYRDGRAACRHGFVPALRWSARGFRLALGQVRGAEAAEPR